MLKNLVQISIILTSVMAFNSCEVTLAATNYCGDMPVLHSRCFSSNDKGRCKKSLKLYKFQYCEQFRSSAEFAWTDCEDCVLKERTNINKNNDYISNTSQESNTEIQETPPGYDTIHQNTFSADTYLPLFTIGRERDENDQVIDPDGDASLYIAGKYNNRACVEKYTNDGNFLWRKIYYNNTGIFGEVKNIMTNNEGNLVALINVGQSYLDGSYIDSYLCILSTDGTILDSNIIDNGFNTASYYDNFDNARYDKSEGNMYSLAYGNDKYYAVSQVTTHFIEDFWITGNWTFLHYGKYYTRYVMFDSDGANSFSDYFSTEHTGGVLYDGTTYSINKIDSLGKGLIFNIYYVKYDTNNFEQLHFISKFNFENNLEDWRYLLPFRSYSKVDIDSNDNVYIPGFYSSITKLNTIGEEILYNKFSPNNEDTLNVIKVNENDLYCMGTTKGSLFSANIGDQDIIFVKSNLNGKKLWAAQLGTSYPDSPGSLFSLNNFKIIIYKNRIYTTFHNYNNSIYSNFFIRFNHTGIGDQ